MPYLLDADWAIQALAGRSAAASTLQRLVPQQVCVSLVPVAEIYEGAFNSSNPGARITEFRRFLHPYRVINLNEPIVERFAEIRAFLRRHA